ncbi:MAG: PDZ domain-containing protein [Candidatus Eremiobacteraeota bacterium]|nr:PDZ domain-containing protein [Candidatus Eremiobacteraeota bacterium]
MNQGYYRYPTVAGDRVVFACEDDLWSAPLSGGPAARLTASAGQCTFPRLSPDGSKIAFISSDEGHPEVFVMPAGGGMPRRLTFLGGTMAAVCGWSPDGADILFVSNPSAWYERETRGFRISAGGGEPRELHLGHMKNFSYGSGGTMAIGRNEQDPARWKRYRGGTSGEIWVDAAGSGEFEKLKLPNGNPTWPMWAAERLYFLADHDGIGNIYSCAPDGSDVERATHESEYYVRFPSTDGRRIAYAAGGALFYYDIETKQTHSIDVECASAAPQTVRRFLDGSEELDEFAPSPDGLHLGVIARGQAFTMPLWDEAPVAHDGSSASRTRGFAWLADGRFACVTDRNGFEQIVIVDRERGHEAVLATKTDIGRVTELVASPASQVVAFANHRFELVILNLEDGSLRTIDTSLGNRVTDLAFSPDGRWLAYVYWPGSDNSSIVRVAKVKTGKVHDVTSQLRVDASPAWDPEGKYLYFISTRDFDPVYDALQFNLGFPQAQRPFVVTLTQGAPNPFAPKPKPVHRDHENEHRDDDARDKKPEGPPRVDIDFDGIVGRILAFPVDEGEYGQIVATKRRVFFTKFDVRGIKPGGRNWDDEEGPSGTLLAYDFDQQRVAPFAHDVGDIALGADGRTLIYRSQDRLRAVDALNDLPEEGEDVQKLGTDAGRKTGWMDLDRISVEVEPRDEWAQMYREAWRLQTEQFWVADMSDIDWDRVYDRYAALLPRIRTRTDLSDVIWEMHGELGTSHAYEIGGDHRIPPQYGRGFLGADFTYDEAAQGWRIARIYRGDSWNREVDSPLAEPGTDIREGDVVVAIGGKRLTRRRTPQEALVNAAGREVVLTLAGRKNGERRVTVKALASEQQLRYRAWVDENRRNVLERTGGKVGYVHIPDMGPWGFSEFHRGYLSEFDRAGLLVDVRYNRGGHVSALLLEKLSRKRVGYDVSRHSKKPVPYPAESVAGPLVGLTNQFAGSDGDIFSHCFKLYGLGPLVGKRTWGGVIGINPYHRLVDGTITTQPEFSFWFKDVGWGVENYGTDPDYDVDIAPQDYRAGRDPQLDFALRLITTSVQAHHEVYPDLATKPSLPLPTLA